MLQEKMVDHLFYWSIALIISLYLFHLLLLEKCTCIYTYHVRTYISYHLAHMHKTHHSRLHTLINPHHTHVHSISQHICTQKILQDTHTWHTLPIDIVYYTIHIIPLCKYMSYHIRKLHTMPVHMECHTDPYVCHTTQYTHHAHTYIMYHIHT